MLKEVYSRKQYLEKRRRFGKFQESNSKIWEKAKYRSKKIKKAKYIRRKIY